MNQSITPLNPRDIGRTPEAIDEICFALCFTYNYFLFVHHSVFKKAKEIYKEKQYATSRSSNETTYSLNDLLIEEPTEDNIDEAKTTSRI